MNYEDILYAERGGVATVTINRPDVYNAFRARTVGHIHLVPTFQFDDCLAIGTAQRAGQHVHRR